MNINVIGVPLFYGCDRKGVENGPNILRENKLISILEKGKSNKVYDFGNLNVKNINSDEKFNSDSKMKYLSPIIDLNTNLAHAVYSSLKSDSFPLVIGGDHSLGMGSIAGASKYFEDDLAVIWIDAHGDINTEETSPSGNIHGMPLAASMNLGSKDLTNLYFNGRKVNPEKVFILCARDLDEGELKLIDKLNLNVWTTKTIKEKGIGTILSELYKRLEEIKVNNIHLSFDIDCLDSSLVPGTGTPVENGMSLDEITYILKAVFETRKIKSMDFVEFNPEIDTNNITLNNCLSLIKVISENI